MQTLRFRKRNTLPPAVLMAVMLAVVGCSSSSSPPSTTPTSPSTPASGTSPAGAEPSTGAAAQAAIKTNFVTFFNPNTPAATRITLLQNGQQFAAVIHAQSSSALAKQSSATVSAVTLNGTSTAGVTYTILFGGKGVPGQTNVTGSAVYQNGTWLVGDGVFCGLLRLEYTGHESQLPAGCKG